MFLFMMNDATTKTTANTLRLMTEAMEAWGAVAAHNATLAPSMMRSANAAGPLAPPEGGLDANWAAEAATLYVRAHRTSWRAALEGWKSLSAMKDVELKNTPFGITGMFASTGPEAAASAAKAARAAAAPAKAKPAAKSASVKAKPSAPVKTGAAAKTDTATKTAPTTKTAAGASSSASTTSSVPKTKAKAAPAKTAAAAPAPQKAARVKAAPQKTAKAAQPAPKPAAPATAAPLKTGSAAATPKLKSLLSAPQGAVDDLTRIKGIGPKLSHALHDLGIYHYWQIAKLSATEIAWINDRLRFKGRIEREQWVEQAKALTGDTASA